MPAQAGRHGFSPPPHCHSTTDQNLSKSRYWQKFFAELFFKKATAFFP
jgi:hypothetical protein